ncbi:MAG: hypothetical protein CMJ84_11765 [Planctomycetes bacterium]|nr:hypothetical protein [Planctomycetota bacterium]MDP6409633.1 sigma factor-like helix-turn-helix DNA-binding protein [Planctomycetota bacterium]
MENTNEDSCRTEEALAHARAGSHAAERRLFHKLWSFLVERTRKSATWPAVKRLRVADAEDIAQGLWVSLFRKDSLAGFEDRGEGSLRAWLNCCLESYLVDTLRMLNAECRGGGALPAALEGGSASTPGPVPASPLPGPSTLVRFSEWAQRCRLALTPREYRVWCLRVDHEFGFEEIGERLDITPAAARGLHHRAIERLRAAGLLGNEESDRI